MSSMNVSSLASNSALSMSQSNSISQKSSLASALLPSTEDSMFGGYSLSDYASIKNGSYGKLMSKYYAKVKAEAASESDSADGSSSSSEASSSSVSLTSYEANGTLDKLLSTYDSSGAAATTEEVTGTEYDTTV
ncbi:MAG: hypothetical protein K6E33_02460 [Lachnospiraceae bacterium]|nr:hypothetical protein [Lachnospiraceae bacterium]